VAELEPDARRAATDAVDALGALHRSALTTVVRRLREDPRGKELLFELVDDPEIRMVLAMHGIIRRDPMTVAAEVMDRVRPGLQSHGGDAELVEIDDGVAYLRLQGACNGCSMAAVTMREGVESALVSAVPGLRSVEVLPAEPTAAFVPLSAVGIGPAPAGAPDLAETGWFKTLPLDRVGEGVLEALSLRPADAGESVEVIVVNTGGRLAAYVNECAHQGLPLDNALVDATEGTITCPWHGFCYDATDGECLTMPGATLRQLPLRVDDGHVWVRASGG
jgi:nitrite reductase/ring-hydroxylating ferredoxin subunit/Fe-S cluster biogenesis protein NfuA